MTAKATQPAPETAKQAAELEAMRRMLDLSSGTFSLSIAVCNSPALRDHLIGKLKESRADIQVVRIAEGVTDVLNYIRQQIDVSHCSAVFIVDLEILLSSSEAKQPVLRSLNASRELLERDLHCPVVIWLPEYAAALLSREAPDLWRYRSHRFEFVSEQAGLSTGLHDGTSGDLGIASNLPIDEKHFRIAELKQRIEEVGPEPDRRLASHVSTWLNELGLLYKHLGDLDQAEQTYRNVLTLGEELDHKEGIAAALCNLGVLYGLSGNLAAAEGMYRKSLAIFQEFGTKEGMASCYGNLGNLSFEMENFSTAEEMYRKALVLDEELGRKQGLADGYTGLGNVYGFTGDAAKAEEMYRKALALYQELGSKVGVANLYCNLGILLKTKGDVAVARDMYLEALAIEEELGRKEGMANLYANLGTLYFSSGELAAAEKMYYRALKLFRQMGSKPRIEAIEALLRELKDGT